MNNYENAIRQNLELRGIYFEDKLISHLEKMHKLMDMKVYSIGIDSDFDKKLIKNYSRVLEETCSAIAYNDNLNLYQGQELYDEYYKMYNIINQMREVIRLLRFRLNKKKLFKRQVTMIGKLENKLFLMSACDGVPTFKWGSEFDYKGRLKKDAKLKFLD